MSFGPGFCFGQGLSLYNLLGLKLFYFIAEHRGRTETACNLRGSCTSVSVKAVRETLNLAQQRRG